MTDKNATRLRAIGTIVSVFVVSVSLIAWASNTGLQAERNSIAIEKLSVSLKSETQCRLDADTKLKESITNQTIATQQGFTEIQVKLSEMDVKLDTNLTYLIKAFDKLE